MDVALHNVWKAFPEAVALRGASFAAHCGEVHALLGENGAGKTTLMNILAGLYQPDEGVLWVGGRRRQWRSPADAIHAGIGMVHQHFKLVPSLTVYENLLVGSAGPVWVRRRDGITRIEVLAREMGLAVDFRAPVWQLSVGERQRVELLRLLWRDARVLVLDEPTSVLTPQEAETLFEILRALARSGRTVIVISHKLEEVLRHADRVTVMRAGRTVATLSAAEASPRELAALMVGHAPPSVVRSPSSPGDEVLVLDRVSVPGDRRPLAVRDATLLLRAGEILGVAGVAGNGQRELAEAIAGLRPVVAGTMRFLGRPLERLSVRDRIDAGVAFIPEDRLRVGLVGEMTALENLIVKRYRRPPLCRRGLLDLRAVRQHAQEAFCRMGLAIPPQVPVRTLSGGTLQRLLLARELAGFPRLIVALSPTRGLDVGAARAVHRALVDAARGGAAVLVISEDLDELLALADRLAVMHEGRIVDTLDRVLVDRTRIGLLMAGGAV